MLLHADRYSQAFSKDGCEVSTRFGKRRKVSFEEYEAGNYPQNDAWMYSSFWYKDFDGMAYKTMLRQLISKWGIMSIEMQSAMDRDMTVINTDGTVDYVESAQAAGIVDVEGAEVIQDTAEQGQAPEPVLSEEPADTEPEGLVFD